MTVSDAQFEVRRAFLGGFIGQLVSGLIWLSSAAAARISGERAAIILLVAAGFFIFPLTQAGLKLIGRPGSLSRENPFGALGMQVAFTLPACLPVIAAAALYRLEWFYPAFMVVLGAHYLPFVTLYGMRMFAVLGAILVGAGVGIGWGGWGTFDTGAWFTGAVLLVFAFIGRAQALDEEGPGPTVMESRSAVSPRSGGAGRDRS